MTGQQYNAFISYRRTERDTAVAKEVQRSLEHFRVPRGVRTRAGRERIDRIFRDQEELEITSNLSRRIEDALHASEYLIVICSPGYSESKWCLHELETFIRLRGRDHVLCVLSEGEPPGVFPELLLHAREEVTAEDGTTVSVETEVEPLACDYRGDFRAARKTELPRLAAVLLGCRYDELVMRRERYRRRRLTALFSGISVLLAAAVSWLLWSNAQISRNYRQSLINESKLLAMRSLDAYDTQDRRSALETALQALPSEETERPVTDEAQYAAAQASYAYSTPYHWLETWRIDTTNDITDFFVSRDGSCVVCVDQSGQFHCFDRATHGELCSFQFADTPLPCTPVEGRDGELLCYDGGEVICLDYRTGNVKWQTPLKYQVLGAVHRSNSGLFIAAEDSFAVQVLTAEGEPYLSLPLPEDCEAYITDLCWSPDDRQIAVKLRFPDATYRIGIFDFESSRFTLTEAPYRKIELFQFDEDGILYLLGKNSENTSVALETATVWTDESYELSAFHTGEREWTSHLKEKSFEDRAFLQTRRTPEKEIVLALGSVIRIYDGKGEELVRQDVRKEITGLRLPEAGAVGFFTVDGEMGSAVPDSGSCQLLRIFPSGAERIVSFQKAGSTKLEYTVLFHGNLCLYENVTDENIRFFDGEGEAQPPEAFLRSGERLAVMTDRRLRFYDLETKAQYAMTELNQNDAWHLLQAGEGAVWLLRICGEDGACSVCAFDPATGAQRGEDGLPIRDIFIGRKLIQGPITAEEEIYLDRAYCGPAPVAVQGEKLFFHDDENCNRIGIYLFTDGTVEELDLSGKTGENLALLYEENGFLMPSPLAVSPDGKTLFTAGTDLHDRSRHALLVRLEDGRVTELPAPPGDLSSVAFTDEGVIYAGENSLYHCSFDGKLLETIPFTGESAISFAWNRGRLYCAFPDSTLRIYENGELLRSLPLSFDLSMKIINGKDFRYEFSDSRLYLYCGSTMNVVTLDSDGTTAVYYAGSVVAHLEDREELLVFSLNRELLEQNSDSSLYLGSFREYSVAELIDRAKEQLAGFEPQWADESSLQEAAPDRDLP